jgi:hypothetical protein
VCTSQLTNASDQLQPGSFAECGVRHHGQTRSPDARKRASSSILRARLLDSDSSNLLMGSSRHIMCRSGWKLRAILDRYRRTDFANRTGHFLRMAVEPGRDWVRRVCLARLEGFGI